jgi:hypothetical protein
VLVCLKVEVSESEIDTDIGGMTAPDVVGIDSVLLEFEDDPEVDVSMFDITVLECCPVALTVLDAWVTVMDAFEALVVVVQVGVVNVMDVVVIEAEGDVDVWEELVVRVCDPEVDESELATGEPVSATEVMLKPEAPRVALEGCLLGDPTDVSTLVVGSTKKVAEIEAAVPDADTQWLEEIAPEEIAGELIVDESMPGRLVEESEEAVDGAGVGDEFVKPVEVAKAVVDDGELVTPCEIVKSIRDEVAPDPNDEEVKAVADEVLLAGASRVGTGVE